MYISPFEHLISTVALSECYICKSESNMLCMACAQKFTTELESRCYKCNKLTKQHRLCASCRSSSKLRRVWWLGRYEETLKKLVYGMKYGRKRYYARKFGVLLSDALPYIPEDTVVVGVPTVSGRRRMRGFDQAELTAQSFARSRKLQYLQPFIRIGQDDQIGKTRYQRMEQIQTTLQLASQTDLQSHSILLIDDVLTTGATLEAAAKLLRENGAKHVDAAVVARHLV